MIRQIDTVLVIIGGPLFVIAVVGYLYVKFRLRPKDGSDIDDDYYYEFEEQHPGYARYIRWSKITFGIAAVAAIMLLAAIMI